jgi:hypothetical protein
MPAINSYRSEKGAEAPSANYDSASGELQSLLPVPYYARRHGPVHVRKPGEEQIDLR